MVKAKSYLLRYGSLYLMLLLPIIFFLVFRYWPMINVLLAFKRNNVILPVMEVDWAAAWDVTMFGRDISIPWMANFERAFSHPPFREAVRNTLLFSVLDIAAGFPAPIILALLLNELKFKRFKKITQTISYMPHFLSWIIISGLAIRLFSPTAGTVNNIIYSWFGMSPIPVLTDPNHWVGMVVGLGVWRSVGWNTIIYLAAITAVSPELHEAAEADGASRLQRMWHITLPGIRPVIIILFILAIGGTMGADFERFMALQNNLVRSMSQVLPVYVFEWGLNNLQFSLAAAVGLFQNIINLVLLLGANVVVKRLGGQGLW
ncbi:MAG: ABC transporter permease subunit [Defluviitaleaceae bacterium]|nr:ABC transporter permease subunit [Defluviitaleaceae bacterium]